MNREDKIKELISKSNVSTDAQTENRILGDALEHLSMLKQRKLPQVGLNIWRIIMKSPITKLAAAAVIIALVLLAAMISAVVSFGWPAAEEMSGMTPISDIGEQLFSEHGFVLPLLIAGVMLLAAVIGAIVIMREK